MLCVTAAISEVSAPLSYVTDHHSALILFARSCIESLRRSPNGDYCILPLALSFVMFIAISIIFSIRPIVSPPKGRATKSFPSRHSIGTTISADFLPAPLKLPYIVLPVADRVASGQHFLSDCLAGVLIGRLALRLAPLFQNANLGTCLMVLCLNVWHNSLRMFAGTVPVLMVPKVLCLLPFLKHAAFKLFGMGKNRGDALKLLTQELFAVSLILFVAAKVKEASEYYDVKSFVGNRYLQKLL
jgi:hypothetical protein